MQLLCHTAAPNVICLGSEQLGSFAGHGVIAPLLVEMLQNIQTELQRYERLVNYWPVYAPMLEETVCAVLRAVTVAVTRQCGVMSARRETMLAASYNRTSAGYVTHAEMPDIYMYGVAVLNTLIVRFGYLQHVD